MARKQLMVIAILCGVISIGVLVYWATHRSTSEIDDHKSQTSEDNVKAILDLANQHLNAKDYSGALKWFRKAADVGDASAMNEIGWMYLKGLGVAKDDKEALKWFRKAADVGDASAMNEIGWMYLKGLGLAKDDKEALKWFRKSADAGETAGMINLGFMYEYGYGLPHYDNVEAAKWYFMAVEAGDKRALGSIRNLYEPLEMSNFGTFISPFTRPVYVQERIKLLKAIKEYEDAVNNLAKTQQDASSPTTQPSSADGRLVSVDESKRRVEAARKNLEAARARYMACP